MSDRLKWVAALSSIGIDPIDALTMDEKSFREKQEFCLDAGLEPIEDLELAKAMVMSLGVDEQLIKQFEQASEPAPPK